jgi:hypothetical protein
MYVESEEIHKKIDKIIAMLEEHIKDRPFKSWNVMGEHKEIQDKFDKIIAMLEEHVKD